MDPEQELEARFLRWREHGRVSELAAVFDRAAPELLGLARRLARNRADAEDLVQATFLVAIERAAAFDASRRLMPWLVGILVNEARNDRRRRMRSPDARRMTVPAPSPTPGEDVEAREFADALERAIASLPARYRDVLRERLGADADSVEIARRLDRRPGTVRVQIARGLELLRRALPAPVAGAMLAWSDRRALAGMRGRVLAAAAPNARVAAPALTSLGVTAAVVLVTAVGGSLALRHGGEADAPEHGSAETASVDRSSPGSEAVRDVAGVDASARGAVLVGRLRDALGAPRAGVVVEAIEADPVRLALDLPAWSGPDAPRPRWIAARSVTGPDGGFALAGLDVASFHALAIDPGGPAASLRLVEPSLSRGAATDLGDVVLRTRAGCSGRVTSEDGAPIAGARIRACDLPAFALETGFADLHRAGALAFRERDGSWRYVALPAAIEPLLERLPWPVARSDESGHFSFELLPAAASALAIEAPGRVTRIVSLPAGDVAACGDVALALGSAIEGSVADTSGAPIADARILCGPIAAMIDVTVLRECGVSDADGRFSIAGLRDAPHLVAAIATGALTPRLVAIGVPAVRPLRIEIAAPAPPLEFRLARADGVPVGATGAMDAWIEPDAAERANPMLDPPVRARLEHAAGGAVRVVNLPIEPCRLSWSVAGCAPASVRVPAGEARSSVEVRLEPARVVAVEIVDAADGASIAGATVAVARAGFSPRFFLGPYVRKLATTDAQGRALLEGLARADEPVRVLHPDYAEANAVVHGEDGAMRVALARGGAVEGRVIEPDGAREPLLVVLHALEQPALPRFARTDAEGRFRIDRLAPGEHAAMVLPAIEEGSIERLYLALTESRPPLAEALVTVVDGGTSVLEIALLRESTALPRERLLGTVLVRGRPAPGLRVRAGAVGDAAAADEVSTDFDGRFDLEVPAGRDLDVLVRDADALFAQLGRVYAIERIDRTTPRPLQIDVRCGAVRGRVVDAATGTPLAFAAVRLRRIEPRERADAVLRYAVSDASGAFAIDDAPAGTYRLNVARDGACEATLGPIAIGADDRVDAGEIRLRSAVEVRGRIEAGTPRPQRIGLESGGCATRFAAVDPSTGAFRLDRVAAGQARIVTLPPIEGLDGRTVFVPGGGIADLRLDVKGAER